MENKTILFNSISLIIAIRENDIKNAQLLVEELNNNFIPTEQIWSLDNIIPLKELYNEFNNANDTLIYVINNLQHINNNDALKWVTTAILALRNNDIDAITDIIIETLKGPMINEQIIFLTQMCVTIDRYDLLKELRDKIKEG